MASCYRSGAGLCIASTNADGACVAASTAATCAVELLGTGNYNNANCNEFKAGCTLASAGGACTARTCTNATGITFNQANCKDWLNTCTANNGNTACVTMAAKCSD